jgi:RimJ/RimL family protein N-acetyltransferase
VSAGPLLTTERFELWRPAATDLDDLVRLIAADETRAFLGPANPAPSAVYERLQRNAGSWALHGYGTFYVRERSGDGQIIANCGVFHSWRGFPEMDDVAEAGWIVRHDWWGKGVAGEVMTAALDWFAAARGPRTVVCMIEEGNARSHRVAQALDFMLCGTQILDDPEPRARVNLYQRPGRPVTCSR